MDGPLTDLCVVEIAGSAAGGYAAKLFADLGAAVTRLTDEAGGAAGPDPLALHLHAAKRSARLDPDDHEARRQWLQWLEWADVVVESSAPEPLEPRAEQPLPRRLVALRISPFGSSGPRAGWRSTAFTDQAFGGHLFLNGEPEREPIARPGLHAHYQAGLHGFIGALAALRARRRTGRGQVVEVSHLEGLASMHQHTLAMWTHGRHVLRREGNRQPGYWHPAGIYPCRDGHVVLDLAIAEHRDRFLVAADLPELLVDPRFSDDLALGRHKDAFDAAIRPWLLARDAAEIVTSLRDVAVPAGPVASFLDVLPDRHLAVRESLRDHGGVRVPASPLRISTPEDARPRGRRAGPRRAAGDDAPQPLAGVRVLDLSRVWAGPLAARLLADLGADVIAVELRNARGGRSLTPEQARQTHLFPDDEPGARPWNRLGSVNEIQRNKRGLTLDLRRPEARVLFERLVSVCDVVLSSFSPRALSRLGLDFETLRSCNPEVIATSITGYGAWGPDAWRLALGPVIEAASGLSHAMGYADSGPYRGGVAWADPVTGLHAAAATLAALHAREADPHRRGRAVEIAMLECMLSMCGEGIAAAQLVGAAPGRAGNRHPVHAPQGVYPCRGDDRWIALAVGSDLEWGALCRGLGLDAGIAELGMAARRARHDEIDALIAGATRALDCSDLVQRLQTAGVSAAPVADARDLCEDPQLAARGFFTAPVHPETGARPMPGCAIALSETPVSYRRPAPRLGEHNREVLGELAGLSDAALDELEAAGVLCDTPP